jgi:hypothetical protein
LASNGPWLFDAFDALNAIFAVRLIPFLSNLLLIESLMHH